MNSTLLANLIDDTNLCDNVNNACNEHIDGTWEKWNSLVMIVIIKYMAKTHLNHKSYSNRNMFDDKNTTKCMLLFLLNVIVLDYI